MVDLVIREGKIVTPRNITSPSWIAVDGGKIVALGSNGGEPEAKKTINASGKYVLPGIVDPENHPIPPLEEVWLTETASAAAGGVTTIGIMQFPGRSPKTYKGDLNRVEDVTTFMEDMPSFLELVKERSMVDHFFTPQMTTEKHAQEIPDLANKYGITSYKLYLHCKTGEHMRDMWHFMKLGMFYYDDGMIYRAMKNIAALGPPAILCLHCENWEIARVLKEELLAQGRTDIAAWDDHSPAFCEAGHVHNYSYYAKVTGCPIYIVHTTTAETVEEIMKARADGVNISAQCAPHYLTLAKDKDTVNVPLRSADNFPKLWEALRTGVIDTIGTDSVWRAGEPETEYKHDVWTREKGWSGGSQISLPIMLGEGVNKGRISLERVVEVCCENTARKFGVYPKKGTIAIGSDADFAIVDLNESKKVNRDMCLSCGRIGWSLYEGMELKGWPVMTILRGNVTMEWRQGEPRPNIVGKPIGEYIPRKLGHELYPLD